MKINKRYLLLFLLLMVTFSFCSGNATAFASLDELPIKSESPDMANIQTLEQAESEVDERTQDELYKNFFPIFIIRTQTIKEATDTEKSFWQTLAEPTITNWLMVLVTLAYLIATIFISNANRKSSDAAQSQLEEARLQQRQNVGIQLYDRRKELMISIGNCDWAAGNKIAREDVFFMFDSNCTKMYDNCCNMKTRYSIYATAIRDYLKIFSEQLPPEIIHLMPRITGYVERLSKEPLQLKGMDLHDLYQFTDGLYLEISPEICNNKANPIKLNLRELDEEANRLLINQRAVQKMLIEEMQTIVENSITIDPQGAHI